jgi:hypothetical protein
MSRLAYNLHKKALEIKPYIVWLYAVNFALCFIFDLNFIKVLLYIGLIEIALVSVIAYKETIDDENNAVTWKAVAAINKLLK